MFLKFRSLYLLKFNINNSIYNLNYDNKDQFYKNLEMKKILILLFLIFISFNSFGQENDCNENLKFKEAFFSHIKFLENNIYLSQNKEFRTSVVFISNYAPVSLGKIMNYARTYPSGVFNDDKLLWLKWYEDNKCKYIQIKSIYSIPEVYQPLKSK